MIKFIDIHTHILPGLDEGASNMEEALTMLQIAEDDGITDIVATPHIMNGIYNNTKETISRAISKIREHRNIPQIFIGAEVRLERDIVTRIDNNEVPLINDRSYLLLELPFFGLPPIEHLEYIISRLKMKGISTIIAHPERNAALLNDISIMEKLMKYGALFQVTAMSITNKLGRKIQKPVLKMIKNGYVHVVASDAHDSRRRSPVLSEAYKKILKKFNQQVAHKLFFDNPLKIIKGESLH